MGHVSRSYPGWHCGRAGNAKRFTSIPISTGGGFDYPTSVNSEFFTCPSIDHIGIHTYDLSMDQARRYLRQAHNLALANGKRVVFEEFGAVPDKAAQMGPLIRYSNQLGIPWMVWQTLKPNNPSDFEFWVEDTAMWQLLTTEAGRALQARSPVSPQ
jgi:mannan endo-1,4-beta-mannosidase